MSNCPTKILYRILIYKDSVYIWIIKSLIGSIIVLESLVKVYDM